MRLRSILGPLGGVTLGLALAASAFAHHSFVMFDTNKQVTVTGAVTTFEWTNPHTYIELDVPADTGGTKHWSIELGSPSILRNSGWNHTTLKAGDKVTLTINPLKTGNPGGLLIYAELASGKKLGNGPGREPAAPKGPAK